MYECDPAVQFNDSNLPDDLCDNIHANTTYCTLNIATGRAIGGQQMSEFPSVAGYPVGGNFSIKYYLLQIHYNNPNLCNNCTDSSGIRFYVGNELRQYDIGYFTFGGDTSVFSLSIPPQVENFAVDSYRRLNASSLLPPSGITIVTAFPHTHLQGKSVWTKLIRNKTAVQYLFDADSYDFNYQFEHKLPEPIQLYPGDEFITRCVYNTMNKNGITLGEGERTQDEMCLHMFTYYPRVNNIYECFSRINATAWGHFFKLNFTPSTTTLQTIFIDISWTLNLAVEWQNFYNNASRVTYYGGSGNLNIISLSKIPKYVDLKQETCTAQSNHSNSTNISPQCGLATRHKIFIILLFVPFLMKIIIDL